MKVLNAAAKWKVHFKTDIPRDKVSIITKIYGASTIRNAFAALKKDLLVEVTMDNTVVVTKKGLELADLNAVDLSNTPSTNEEYLESQKKAMKLTDRECEVIDAIADGLIHTKDEIAESLKMKKNSTFRNLMAALKKKGFIVYTGADSVQLHEDMTPFEN